MITHNRLLLQYVLMNVNKIYFFYGVINVFNIRGSFDIRSNQRDKSVIKNFTLSFLYKFFGILINFLIIPLTVNYLDKIQYGIWATLLSIMTWITFFDIGLGYGLRNKMTEAISRNDIKTVKIYLSTGYFTILFIAFILFGLLSISVLFVDFTIIFNTSYLSNNDFMRLIFFVGTFMIGNFVLSLINQVFFAYQKASLVGLVNLISSFVTLGLVYLLINFTVSNLLYYGLGYGTALFFTNMLATLLFFHKHKEITPSIKYFDISKIKDITNLGAQFFIIQISSLVVFFTSNILVSQLLGPDKVQAYDIAFKIFSVISMLHNMLLTPLWPAYTKAYVENDIKWIRGTIKKLNLLMIPIIFVTIIVAIFVTDIVRIWTGINMTFPKYLLFYMAVYTIVSTWNNIYAFFLSGVSKVNLQIYTAVLGAIIYIPLGVYLVQYQGMGSPGIVLAGIISLLLSSIVTPIHSYYILRTKEEKLNVI